MYCKARAPPEECGAFYLIKFLFVIGVVLWAPRKLGTLQQLYGDKKAATEAARQEKSISMPD
jgi:hypothetical protein